MKALGVDIIWLMPVQEIGKKNRKGGLGSPYSVKDYYSINPELGDLDSLKQFVAAAHDNGLYVILDWVANHTAWDNPLTEEHPEWYSRTRKGEIPSNAGDGLVGHHRAGLQPAWSAPLHDRRDEMVGDRRPVLTASAAMWPVMCRWISGTICELNWTPSSPFLCWLSGNHVICMRRPST